MGCGSTVDKTTEMGYYMSRSSSEIGGLFTTPIAKRSSRIDCTMFTQAITYLARLAWSILYWTLHRFGFESPNSTLARNFFRRSFREWPSSIKSSCGTATVFHRQLAIYNRRVRYIFQYTNCQKHLARVVQFTKRGLQLCRSTRFRLVPPN